MNGITQLYGERSLALLTDLYQLTMAQGYWKVGEARREAVFHLFFRRAPFRGGYAVACGMRAVAEVLDRFAFDDDDLAYLATLRGNDDAPLFEEDFLAYLGDMRFECDVDAVLEGTIVFPQEPMIRVQGPLIQCQLAETPLLTLVNHQTLIATKASRICRAARGEPVLEFGLRRAHGVDGGVSGARAAIVGGCAGTSNVLAGKLFDIPVKGTHAHSWVMSFDSELEAFEAYAQAMPNNCVFLVDTYDTLEGVRRAAQVGARLREEGHEMVGVRLDSGDLASLSREARKILDDAGFPDAAIVASNDLDEHSIARLKREGATIAVWGVGTKLATAYDDPALGGVYKLSAIRDDPGAPWAYKVKRSEQAATSSNPGIMQVRRFVTPAGDRLVRDVIYDEPTGCDPPAEVVDLVKTDRVEAVPADGQWEDLLRPLARRGEILLDEEPVSDARARALAGLAQLDEGVKAFEDASRYPVGLERKLFEIKAALLRRAVRDQL